MSRQTDQKLLPWVAYPAALLAVYLLAQGSVGGCEPEGGRVQGDTVPGAAFTAADATAAAAIVSATVAGVPAKASPSARLTEPNRGIYVALRQGGKSRGSAWSTSGTVAEGLAAATRSALDKARNAQPDRAEVCIAHTYRTHRVRRTRRFIGNIHRGVRGLELNRKRDMVRHSPTEMVARNLAFGRALELFMEKHGLDAGDLRAGAVQARTFECEQLLVKLDTTDAADSTPVTQLHRGNQVIAQSAVTQQSVRDFERSLGDYMLANLHPDGRMTYKFWPSRGQEAPSNNMIRQWMATLALVRLGNFERDPQIQARALANIRYNLSRFYRKEGELGLIEWNGKVKLGSIALAALAIMEHPKRDELAEYELALRAATFALQKDNGRFRPFYKPRTLDSNHNFYPGEAQLYWCLLYLREPDPKLLARIMKSFRYYRGWHRDHRNPAFIPWHTQAYVNLWMTTRDDELRDWAFEMSDWLLSMQETEPSRYADTLGRFYDSKRSHYGPPHASATGVYMEGLIDAYRLAVEVGDQARANRYRKALLLGLRSSMQLQLADDVDMFYVHAKHRHRVRGGLRTTVYDNAIRIDNVQHTLLGIFRITRTFGADDYAL